MIICFNCSFETKDKLDKLLESRQYKDYSEIISLAVDNLALLQGELAGKGALVIENTEVNSASIVSPFRKEQRSEQSNSPQPTNGNVEKKKSAIKTQHTTRGLHIPAIFILEGINGPPSSLASLPSDVWVPGQNVPLDRWIFGQYNKLLPAKANCRALAHLLKEEPKGMALEMAVSNITEQAVILGDFLTHYDEQNGIGRDDAFSTAFPSSGDKVDKSRARYANQFVAGTNKHGQVFGLLVDFKLINHTGGKSPRILLTDVGWRFATLRNPIFDDPLVTPMQKFSSEEIAFLLEHIARSVPAEHFAYRVILEAINEGENTPEKIDFALEKYIPNDKKNTLSKSFLSSQRSGAISRMTDLGLVTRVREGVRVSYTVTEIGKQYVEKRK